MTTITIEVPDELAAQLDPDTLSLMLREVVARRTAGLESNDQGSRQSSPIYREITEFLSGSPAIEQILAFKISSIAQARLEDLLYRNREDVLTPQERAELDTYLQLSEWISILKARARSGKPLLG
ncbi:MAG TPA: hypothetical protein VJ302_34410 [Blastocatellia bacterium]|nr:hypothetical protein [Blastocatellia bacterium]